MEFIFFYATNLTQKKKRKYTWLSNRRDPLLLPLQPPRARLTVSKRYDIYYYSNIFVIYSNLWYSDV